MVCLQFSNVTKDLGNIQKTAGVPAGPGMRTVLAHLYQKWKESGYKSKTEELLDSVGEVVIPPASKRKKP